MAYSRMTFTNQCDNTCSQFPPDDKFLPPIQPYEYQINKLWINCAAPRFGDN